MHKVQHKGQTYSLFDLYVCVQGLAHLFLTSLNYTRDIN